MARMSHRADRRGFLQSTGSLLSAATAAAWFPWTNTGFANTMANDRPRIGCIGLGGMGRGDAIGHKKFGDILAICDVDQRHANRANEDEKIGEGKTDVYSDYRKVLERSDIDVVSVVTPDHWHVKIAIEALQAGKHVFCQKPLTLTLEENQLIRNAAKKYKDQVFLVGTQQRSDRNLFLRAVNMVHKYGQLGEPTAGVDRGFAFANAGGGYQRGVIASRYARRAGGNRPTNGHGQGAGR